ncbi:MAG: hypothetical protein F7C34_02230 [Desulfurococcales archaeon]|nr:hypothetical protein [Desulfurococcales archaeon]
MPGKPCLGIRCLIKRLIEAKYREEQQPQPQIPPPRRREDPLERLSPEERQKLLEAKSHAQLIASQLNIAAQEAKRRIEEYLRENEDPLVQLIYKEAWLYDAGTGMENTPINIIAIALADAIEKGYHKDPQKLAKYILAYHTALARNLQLPHPNTLKEILKRDPLVYRDELYELLHLEEVPSILGRALRHGEETKELGEKIYSEAREIERNWRYDLTVDPEEYARFRINFLRQQGIDITRELEEVERELRGEIVPGHTESRRLLGKAIAEQLPGWAVKVLLDQEKMPLYASPEGIHPSIVKYHIQRADPSDPKGTLLHGLMSTVLSEWEREIASGEQPSHPLEVIRRLIGTELRGELTEEEARRIAQNLGLPQDVAPRILSKTLRELLRDLGELRNGKDSHLLDAEKEAALRYHQLRLLANNKETHPYEGRILLEGKQAVLDIYREIKNRVLEETHLGREEQEKALNVLERILRESID